MEYCGEGGLIDSFVQYGSEKLIILIGLNIKC